MLAFVVLMFAGICGFGKMAITLMPSIKRFVEYTSMRWALGEFLVCWLAADHAFSELGGARRKGHLRDWLTTPTTLGEIATAFTRSTSSLLVLAVIAAGIIEACVPYGSNFIARMFRDDARMQILYQVSIAIIITICHAATARYASVRTTQSALHGSATSATWVNVLGRMGLELGIITAISVLVAYCVSALLTDNTPSPLSFASMRDPRFLTAFLLVLAVTNLALTMALPRVLLRRVGAMPTPDTVPDAG